MHVGCEANTICAWGKAADDLPEEFLVGLFLHEYGHCVVGNDEKAADRWSFDALGIPIQYVDHGKIKDLEWVDPLIIAERQI
jgi:hypothetical protein